MLVRTETLADHDAIRMVNRLAFGQDAEANLVEDLRDGGYARLSMVADESGRIVGHVLFSELAIQTATGYVSSLSLAPIAVIPECQRMGIGSTLIREGLRVCREQGHKSVVVLGHQAFYPRFGFDAQLAEGLSCSFYAGPSLMALELVPGALDGIVGELKYSPPFQKL